jgi:peptidoglycan/LPS O-acetylase OafA/YrhL
MVITQAHTTAQWLGVAFFFVISGFVICSGLTREFEIRGRVSIGSFYVRRCFRILPPLILFLISVWALKIVPPRSTGNAALFLCNLAPCDLKIAHTWSLAYEEQFYILFPIALILLLTCQQRWPLLALAHACFVPGMVRASAFRRDSGAVSR